MNWIGFVMWGIMLTILMLSSVLLLLTGALILLAMTGSTTITTLMIVIEVSSLIALALSYMWFTEKA